MGDMRGVREKEGDRIQKGTGMNHKSRLRRYCDWCGDAVGEGDYQTFAGSKIYHCDKRECERELFRGLDWEGEELWI